MSNYQLSINNYQLPEGYKQTEVGVIPEDWDVKATGEICDFIVPGRNKPKSFKGNIPWITTPDLEDGRSVSVSKVGLFVSREEAKSVGSKIVPKGSVLMSCVGELGIVAIAEREIVINQQLHAFIPTEKIDAFFLLNALQAQKDYMLSIATITAVPYLNKDNCNSIPIPLPPLPEQRAIAQTLSDVDALIAALDKLIAKQRHLKTATMQQLLTGKKRLPGFGERKAYQQTEVGIIPEDWDIKKLGQFLHIRHGKSQHEVVDPNGAYPILATGGEIGRTNTTLYSEPSFLIVRKGTIDIPYYMDTPFWTVDTLFYSEIFKNADPKFIFYKFNLIDWYSYNEASGVPSLNAATIENIDQAFPTRLEEQRAIAVVLSDMDAAISALETRRAKTQAIKQGMMQELLTGRVRLTIDSASQ